MNGKVNFTSCRRVAGKAYNGANGKNFEQDSFEQYSFSDKVKVGIYEDFEIDFSEVSLE